VIAVIHTGPLNTVQDLGRPGFRNIGVTASGAMDPVALTIGNLLIGNSEGAAAIEVQTFPFRLRFEQSTVFSITGADCGARLDDKALPPFWAHAASTGQVLELSTPMQFCRAYICLAGGIDVTPLMGSRSTSLRGAFGGFEGRFLAAGDRLPLGQGADSGLPAAGIGVVPPHIALAEYFPMCADGDLLLRAIPAGEHALFGADAERFWSQSWKISSQSDRTGYRLSGDPIKPMVPVEMRSHGLVPGVVQVPPAGEPIIQMSDANTAGGYPKIAGIIEVDLWRLGQARIGSRIRFVQSDVREALAAERALKAYIADIFRTGPQVLDALAGMSRR
jgi:biotin-dependent carboxylase-like uncharacterized protein